MIKSAVLSFLAIASLLIFNPLAFAQEGPVLDDACNEAPSSPVCNQAANTGANDNPAVRIIKSAANIVAVVAGVAAVIMIILGGFTLITSAGNQESVSKARRRVVYSLVGLAIVGLAWTITRLITDRVLQ